MEEESDQVPDWVKPESIEIVPADEGGAEPEAAVFSGEVASFKVGDSDVLGTAQDPRSGAGLSNGAWFAIGLLVAPMAVGFVSFVLAAVGDGLIWQDYDEGYHYDDVLVQRGTEEIAGESYRLYEAGFPDMDPSRFDSADVYVNTESHDCWSYKYPSSDWARMDCYSWNGGDPEVYVKLDGNDEPVGIMFAVGTSDSDRPIYAQLMEYRDGGGSEMLGELLLFLSLLVWPIALIAGLVWGFTKGNNYFAYGMLASIVVVPVLCFGAMFILVLIIFGGGW